MLERINRWLEFQSKKLALQNGIFVCRRVLRVSTQVHNIQMIQMAGLAETLLPILENELKEHRNGRSS